MTVVKYNTNIYNPVIIEKAIKDYVGLCKISVIYHKNDAICTFGSTKIDKALVANEFDNYLIELMQNKK